MSVNGVTPEQCFDVLVSYYRFLKEKEVERVVLCTDIADGTTSIHNNNRVLRELVLANPTAVADAICDWGALPEFDDQADASNPTYYQSDHIHQTAAGTAKLAPPLALVV